MLAVGTGVSFVGANQGVNGVDAPLANSEGDVSANFFVEVGEQTFSVFNRAGGLIETSSLNQFFLDAGADLQGDTLQAPRVIFDRAADRWFIIATGAGNGSFAGNRIHIAFSDTADPSGQWQQVDFAPDPTGQLVHTRATLGVDADGVYFATQNFEQDGNQLADLVDVSIYSVPKADLLQANPTLLRITQFNNLSIFDYGQSIQFASNFDASDGTVYAFSTQTIDLNAGTVLDPVAELSPSNINTFQITGATDLGAVLSETTVINVGNFSNPLPIVQPGVDADGDGVADDDDGDGLPDTFILEVDAGITASLIESNNSVFIAQTVSFPFVEGGQSTQTNGINWFEFVVDGGSTPALAGSALRGPNNFTRIDTSPLGDILPDTPDLDPMIDTFETGIDTFFNLAIAVNEAGVVALTYNRVSQAIAFDAGVVGIGTALRVSVEAQIGIQVNSAETDTTAAGDSVFGRSSIQFAAPELLVTSVSSQPFDQSPAATVFGAYSSLRPDPSNPSGFLSVAPFQEVQNSNTYAVALTEIFPVDFQPVLEGTPLADEIVVRVNADDPSVTEIVINGVVNDSFQSELLSAITLFGHDGADTIIIDHTNGDPTPEGGFLIHGGEGIDTLESRSAEETFFELNSVAFTFDGSFVPAVDLGGFIGVEFPASLADAGFAQDGQFILTTQAGDDLATEEQVSNIFVDIEGVIGGSNDDTFQFVNGSLFGNADGLGGDDRFVFLNDVSTSGSVNGGTGFNTLDLQQRIAQTEIDLFSIGANAGFNGQTLSGPIGDPGQILDQFRDISLIRGSTNTNVSDSILALDQFESTFTIVAPSIEPNDVANPADADEFQASTYEANGRTLFFTDFETLSGSVLNDVFNVQSNSPEQDLILNGLSGDDVFNFSSDAPTNEGVLAPLDGLFQVNGGTGSNSLIVSDFGRFGTDSFQVLAARISGLSDPDDPNGNPTPIEIIYFAEDPVTMEEGTFDVTLLGSDGAAGDTFFLESFLTTNTLNVFGNGGDDIFNIGDLNQATVNLFGGEGDDTYIIEQVAGLDTRNVIITDSVDAENDRALIAGTVLDETFIVDLDSFVSEQFEFIGIEEFGFDGRGGDDEFFIREISDEFPIVLLGGDGNDTFFISSDAPTNLGDLSAINNDLNIDGGTGQNQILISNESGGALDVVVNSTTITGLFTSGVLTYSATGGSFGGTAGGIEIIGSNGADDQFLINSFLAENALRIDGRLGEDEFTIGGPDGDNIAGEVVVDGASDGDIYNIFVGNLASENVILQDSGFSGSDLLNVIGTEGDDAVTLSEFGLSSGGSNVAVGDFIEEVAITGLGGDDNITLINSPAEFVTIFGNAGNDTFNIEGTVGVLTLDIFGGIGNDLFQINETSSLTNSNALGGDGDDIFNISPLVSGDVNADGEEGSDQYFVEFIGAGSRVVNIIDSGSDGIDTGAVFGTQDSDQFDINNINVGSSSESVIFNTTLESLSVSGRGDADVFNVAESDMDLLLDGQNGNDTFNLSSNAPSLSGSASVILGDVTIQGGNGLNQLNITNQAGAASVVTVTNTAITGLTGGLLQYFSNDGQFARADGEIGGIEIFGSNDIAQGDTFNLVSLAEGDTIRVNGLAGDDIFVIGNGTAGDVFVDGGNGSDTYEFQFGSPFARDVVIEDSGTTGADTLSLVGSEGNDFITVSTTSIFDGNSSLTFNVGLGVIEIMALGGNDTFIVNGAFDANVRLYGNDGNDTFTVNSTANIEDLDLIGGVGDDNFVLNGSSDPTRIDAFGQDGNDTFIVQQGAAGAIFLDGQEGSDAYTVFFAGNGERRIDTRDSGTTGVDTTLAVGTDLADRIAVRTTRLIYDDEIVIFDENTEQVNTNAGNGNDRIVVFGSRASFTGINASNGNDVFVVNSTAQADEFTLAGGEGNDTFNVTRIAAATSINLFGNQGSDRFNIGSTIGADNGNLGTIRGDLNVIGGGNAVGTEDQLIVNDTQGNGAFSYSITPTRIDAIAGPNNLPRDNFAGIGYDAGIEFVRLDGTTFANFFQITASPTTRFFIDGNAPSSNVGDQLTVVFQANDGRQLFETNPQLGNGFVSFTNGNEIIQFENIETPVLATSGAGAFTLPDDFDFSGLGDDVFEEFDEDDLLDIGVELKSAKG